MCTEKSVFPQSSRSKLLLKRFFLLAKVRFLSPSGNVAKNQQPLGNIPFAKTVIWEKRCKAG